METGKSSVLQALLEKLLGPKMAAKVSGYTDSYRGHELPKGALNVDAAPAMYIDEGKQVMVVPDKDWKTAAKGEYSLLGGIRVPQTSYPMYGQQTMPEVLAHENFHARDTGTPAGSQNLSNLAQRAAAAALGGGRPVGVTGQPTPDEFMAQMVAMEAMLPAGQKAKQTDFWKRLQVTPEEIASYLNRRYPKPKDVDAVTGVPE